MDGLIQQKMQTVAASPTGMGAAPEEGAMSPDGMGEQNEQFKMEEQGEGPEPDENNPAFKQAMQYAMEALYDRGAAKDIAQQLKAAPSPVDGASNIAYEVVSVVDERTDGQVPDELLMMLSMNILGEVVEIADAAGLDMKPVDIADAFKQMLLRYLGEQGMDTTQLQQAMDQVDPSLFEKAAQGEEVPA
jgi:hypothetical protein